MGTAKQKPRLTERVTFRLTKSERDALFALYARSERCEMIRRAVLRDVRRRQKVIETTDR